MKRIILVIILLLIFGCKHNQENILSEDDCTSCGKIIFQFSKDLIEEEARDPGEAYNYGFLNVLIKINDKIELNKMGLGKRISDDSIFIKKTFEGDIKISYSIITLGMLQNFYLLYSYTGFKDDSICF